MTFPKFARFGLGVSILGLIYQIFLIFTGPPDLPTRFLLVLGILAAIIGMLYFTNELRSED